MARTTESQETREKPSRLRKASASVALAAAAFGLVGCGETSDTTPPDAGQVIATTEATPTPTATETAEPQPTTPAEVIAAIDATKVPENILELGTYSLLSPEAQAKMQSLYDVDVPTFRESLYEDQVAFCMQIFDNIRPIVDYMLSENNINLHYTDNPTTTQQRQDNFTYMQIVATNFVTEKDGSYSFDNELAQKFESVMQDVRVTVEGSLDATYGQITMATLPSYSSMYETWKSTVSNESVAEDGTITYTQTTEAGEVYTTQIKPVAYSSVLDGTAKQLYVVVDNQ